MTLEFYILRQLIVGLVFAAGGMAFVALPGILVTAVNKLAGVGMGAILGFVPLLMLDLVPYLIPIGFLLALVATYGRLAADNEWTAMSMAGLHPLKLVRPAALVALVLGALLYLLATEVAPHATFAMRNYTKNSAMRLLRTLNPGRTELKIRDFYLSARERDPDNRYRFRQVVMHVPSTNGQPAEILFAQAAEFSFDESKMFVDLTAPRWIGEAHDVRGGKVRLETDLDALFSTGDDDRRDWRFQSSPELSRRIDRSLELVASGGKAALEAKEGDDDYVPADSLNAALYALHMREALAAVCFMFLLLGVPTALLLRRGTQLGALTAAVGYALVYYLLSMRLGKSLAWSGVVPQWLAAWGTTMLGSAVGLVMSFVALRR